MPNISQKELLNELFWDKFPSSVRKGVEAVKQIGKVVAPEIADPISKGMEKMRDIRKNIKRAGMTSDENVVEQLMEFGLIPYKNEKVRWKKGARNPDGTITGSIKVGTLGYTDEGEPYMESEFSDPLKRDVIFKYDPKTRDVKIVRYPYRNLQVVGSKQQNQNNP